jgi:hypothetical protein
MLLPVPSKVERDEHVPLLVTALIAALIIILV